MRAAKIVEREINLGTIDVNVRIVGKSKANAIVKGEHELAVGDVILQALGRGQRGRSLLAAIKAERGLQRRA
jgi:hypothetical protein